MRRILVELDRATSGTLVTIAAEGSGWAPSDASLELALAHFDTQNLALPLHRLTSRVLMSHRLARFHVPDARVWITRMAGRVVRNLRTKPDIIYSRSQPMSAALLARNLKRRLNIPWIMHLSDPWVENPHGGVASAHNIADEADCFAQADRIALTTEGQAAHYRKKYPALASKIIVSPNMMPDTQELERLRSAASSAASDDRLRLVFTGNLYGNRSPAPLIQAIEWLRATQPQILSHLRIDIYGHAQDEARALLERAADPLYYHGPVPFAQAAAAQRGADIVISMEPIGDDPLAKCFLPSKVLECLAIEKPLLAITPEGSEVDRICREGYGWAISPALPEAIGACLAERITQLYTLRNTPAKTAPERYQAHTVTRDLLVHMQQLIT